MSKLALLMYYIYKFIADPLFHLLVQAALLSQDLTLRFTRFLVFSLVSCASTFLLR